MEGKTKDKRQENTKRETRNENRVPSSKYQATKLAHFLS